MKTQEQVTTLLGQLRERWKNELGQPLPDDLILEAANDAIERHKAYELEVVRSLPAADALALIVEIQSQVLEPDVSVKELVLEEPRKHPGGRPPGSKNKPKYVGEA